MDDGTRVLTPTALLRTSHTAQQCNAKKGQLLTAAPAFEHGGLIRHPTAKPKPQHPPGKRLQAPECFGASPICTEPQGQQPLANTSHVYPTCTPVTATG